MNHDWGWILVVKKKLRDLASKMGAVKHQHFSAEPQLKAYANADS